MTKSPKLVFYRSRSKTQPWRWKLVGGNGERVASGEGHPTKAKAERAARNVARLIAELIAKGIVT